MIYKGHKTKNISFPLGGIGTGCIGLAGNGALNDWEIFNRPNKNSRNGYSHFAVKATYAGKSITKILHGDTSENFTGQGRDGFGYGPKDYSLAGFPHFRDVTFEGNYPVARLDFSDGDFPAKLCLFAFNPFIPQDEFNSSLPAAFFEWEIENIINEKIKIAIAGTVRNPAESSQNKKVLTDKESGLLLGSSNIDENEIRYSDLCILTDHPDVVIQEYWYRARRQDSCATYWRNLSSLDRMPERSYPDPSKNDHGTVVTHIELEPNEKKRIRFVIAWNVPNAYNYWDPNHEGTWRNYYATQFKDSFATASYALENFSSLYKKTLQFSDALQACTLPDPVKEAISANLSVIKTPTALRLEDGSFWGWEGCGEIAGSCHGTCQHVWNYAYVLPYLFPKLERSIREMTMKYALLESGATEFRINLPTQKITSVWRSCVDGQMGEVIKCYREWKFSGDDKWLAEHAECIFKMLDYAWSKENPDQWDADMDGVLEGRQHHTLDVEILGPSSWLEGLYLLALDCGAKMAAYLGDEKRANLYAKLYDNGKKWMNDNLFNGKYFCQKIDLSDKTLAARFNAEDTYWDDDAKEIKYQIGEGCIIDQMLADWHATLLGANCIFDHEKKKIALENLYKNNFKSSMRDVLNVWRIFCLNDEAGTVMCSYPDGAQMPAVPIHYWQETMTGFEYALAGLLIAEGYVAEGECIVKAVRDRYDGEKRNPWNEIECGSNYARSMASYALMAIYSGFTFDMTRKHIGFAPLSGNGKYLFSACESWGSVEFHDGCCCVSILGKPLALSSISIPDCEKVTNVIVDGTSLDFEIVDEKLVLGNVEIHRELRLS